MFIALPDDALNINDFLTSPSAENGISRCSIHMEILSCYSQQFVKKRKGNELISGIYRFGAHSSQYNYSFCTQAILSFSGHISLCKFALALDGITKCVSIEVK